MESPSERAEATRPVYAVVTGGGTAGHVLPALAVADALVARGVDPDELFYVGCQRGIETELLPDTPYRHEFLDVVGFQRSLSRRNLGFVPKMLRAARRATALLRRIRPRVVVSVGGYASMPAVLAAKRLGVPIVTVSFDHRPGRASSLSARFSAASAVAFPDSPLPRAVMTGAPVRGDILAVDRSGHREQARTRLGIPADRFMIAVMGGSQGSAALNRAVWGYLDRHRTDRRLAIRHAVGRRFIADAPSPTDGASGALYQPIGYEANMASVYEAADLLVGRGGASTVHEVAATATPAILVPWPGAAEDHQTGNVAWLARRGGAVLLPESEIARFDQIVDGLRSSPDRLRALSEHAAETGADSRNGALAELIVEVAGGESGMPQP